MNQIEQIQAQVRTEFPDLEFELIRPNTETGHWFLVIDRPGRNPVAVE